MAIQEPSLTAATADNDKCQDPLLAPAAEDSFYQDADPDIVRVFPIDYERLVQRLKQAKWFALAASIVLFIIFLCLPEPPREQNDAGPICLYLAGVLGAVLAGMVCTEGRQQVRIRGQHVAVTRRGIRRDCTDESGMHTTTTIPWGQIRRVERRSHGVVVIVMRSRTSKPIEIPGLLDLYDFIELVNIMKDNAESGMVL